MSEKDPYKIFVTHAFQEHEEYSRVFEYLEAKDNFFYLNSSDPDGKPEHGGEEGLKEAIRKQIEPAEVVLFPVGVHAQDPKVVEFELSVAKVLKKPIVAIKAHGGTQSLPQKAMEAAVESVEWNNRQMIDAVRHHGRGEDVGKWDVIEFDPD